MCFQGDRGPKGACGGDGPKGEKVGLRETKCSLVGDQEEISMDDDAVCVERFLSFYSVIILVNN